jgi:archaeal flagellar protein FlaG
MGSGVSASHMIFFIAALVLSVSVVGALHGTTSRLAGGIGSRGDHLHDELTTNIRIVNDPAKMPNPLNLYVMNTGSRTIPTSEVFVLIDGTAHTALTFTVLGGSATWRTGEVVEITTGQNLAGGDHARAVVVAHGVSDTIWFNIP